MKKIICFIAILILSSAPILLGQNQEQILFFDDYHYALSANVNYAEVMSKHIYYIVQGGRIGKSLAREHLRNMNNAIATALDDLGRINETTPAEEKTKMKKYLIGIEKHLKNAQSYYVNLADAFNKEKIDQTEIEDISSKLYYELKESEESDHAAIRKMKNLIIREEPKKKNE